MEKGRAGGGVKVSLRHWILKIDVSVESKNLLFGTFKDPSHGDFRY